MALPTSVPPINARSALHKFLQDLRDTVASLSTLEGTDITALGKKTADRLHSAVVAGTTSATNIAVAGITTDDHIVSVVRLDVAADSGTSATGNKVQDASDLTSEATIQSAGNIRLSTTDTSGDKLLVLWLDQT